MYSVGSGNYSSSSGSKIQELFWTIQPFAKESSGTLYINLMGKTEREV